MSDRIPALLMSSTPFEITDDNGERQASNGERYMRLLDADGRMFRRRAAKGIGSGQMQMIEWVVCELAGVRVYFDGMTVVVTRRDIQP